MIYRIWLICCINLFSVSLISIEYVATRMSIGPAWHEFFSYQSYSLTSTEFFGLQPQDETIQTGFDLMPWVEGYVDVITKTPFTFTCLVAGGAVHNAQQTSIRTLTSIIGSQPIEVVREAATKIGIAVFDIDVGINLSVTDMLICRPVVGYLFNHERLLLSVLQSGDFYRLNNRWQGGYVGLRLALQLQRFHMSLWYKGIIGNMRSNLYVTLTEASALIVPSSDSVRSSRTAGAFGNLIRAELSYTYNCWQLGTMAEFFQYRNHCDGLVHIGNTRGAVIGSTLKRIFWEQFAWTFFVEYDF